MDDKYCIGCGVKLQDENMREIGYTTSIENDIWGIYRNFKEC